MASPFIITLNNRTSHPRQVVEAAIYNAPGVTGANGSWNFGTPDVFTLASEGGVVGTSGALRIKRVGVKEIGHVVAFGHWNNNRMWIGIAGDIPPDSAETAATVLPQFYGSGGEFNVEGKFWTSGFGFARNNILTREQVTIVVTTVSGALNALVTIVNT